MRDPGNLKWKQARIIKRSGADIRAFINSAKAKADAARLEEHIRKHGIDPTAAQLEDIPLLSDDELAIYRMRQA